MKKNKRRKLKLSKNIISSLNEMNNIFGGTATGGNGEPTNTHPKSEKQDNCPLKTVTCKTCPVIGTKDCFTNDC